MFKKIILAAATIAIVAVAYQIYSWQDDTLPRKQPTSTAPLPPRVSSQIRSASQPAAATDFNDRAFSLGDATVPPGEAPVFRMYDRRGNAKIIFRSIDWRWVSDDELHMEGPTARLLLPGGQLAYVRADEGQVTVHKADNNNLDAKKGWFRGHVSIFIDLTKPEWRKAHPGLAEPEQHPETVVKIWLDDARFDLDLTRLESQGPIRLESARGTIEGRGLTLVWNEMDRRVRLLSIAEGKRAMLRQVELASFERSDRTKERAATPGSGPPAATPPSVVKASARPSSDGAASKKPPQQDELSFLEVGDLQDKPREDRVDTYRIVFADNIVAQQKAGIEVAGRLTADVLELLCDFGREERDVLEQSPATRPAEAGETQGATPLPAAATARAKSTVELQWTGALTIEPAEQTPEDKPSAGNRVHVIARGSPVHIGNRNAGDATCLEMEYHAETELIWLRGAPDQLVTLQSGPHQRLMGEQIHVDQKAGTADITGAGRLVGRASDWGGQEPSLLESTRADAGTSEEVETVEIAWTKSVRIAFGVADPQATTPLGGTSLIPEGTYLKRADFDGDVTFSQPGQSSIVADHAEVTFKEPIPGEPSDRAKDVIVADRVLASGSVHMTQTKGGTIEHVFCDRLEVEMTLNDVGKNVPKLARALGHVVARQEPASRRVLRAASEKSSRQISAGDELVIEIASIPNPPGEDSITEYKAKAREKGIQPGSVEWVNFEQKLRDRRRLATTRMTAKGNVGVQDPEQRLDLAADTLDCTFGNDEEIQQAVIVGTDDAPASVELEDFLIRGPRIDLDMTTQSAKVPGGGRLRFLSKQDLDGRAVEEPIPVVVTWQDGMLLEGHKNAGRFTGGARAVSESIVLDCRELQLWFQDLPRPPAAAAPQATGPDPRWLAGPVIDAFRPADKASPTSRVARQMRKRLSSVDAIGDAVIQSAVYAEPEAARPSPAVRVYQSITPEWLKAPADASPAADARLSSRVRLAGPQIAIDLVNERLSVNGAGNLSIEDYRPQLARRPERDRTAGSSLLDGASVAALNSIGPSQTAFAWENSMLFVNDHNLAVFDRDVKMRHLAGSRMLDLERLALATHIDVKQLQQLEGREASLTCDNLLVEFERDAAQRESDPSPLSRATRLKSFKALGLVRLEENNRGVIGAQVSYRADTGIGRVLGSQRLPAKLFILDERTGRKAISSVDTFEWNQKTGVIRAHGPRILNTTE